MENHTKLISSEDTPLEDRRGGHALHNKSDLESVQHLKQFINSIPAYHSHYSTKDNNARRKYLASNLNMRILYKQKGFVVVGFPTYF